MRIIYNAANFQLAGKASRSFGGNIRMIERRVMQEFFLWCRRLDVLMLR